LNEKELVAKAVKGDKTAFEQIVFAYEKKVYNMALRYTGNPHDALDISQEVFLRVYRFLPKYGGRSSLSTWIYRITMNVCHDSAKMRTNIFETSLDMKYEDDDVQTEIADVRFDPEAILENKEVSELIKQGIVALEDTYRDVIVMRDINGMSYDEIARVLDISEGTVKSRIFRAREKLRAFLCKNGNFSAFTKSNNNVE